MATKFEERASATTSVERSPTPHRSSRRWLIGSLVLAVLVAIGLLAWLNFDHATTPPSTGASAPASSIKYQALGTPVMLVSGDGQTRLTVKVTLWRQPAPPGEFRPKPGNVIALAVADLTNNGSKPVTVPFSVFKAIGSDGGAYPALDSGMTATITGVMGMGAGFEIPASANITSIQVSLGSGPNATGRWVLHQ